MKRTKILTVIVAAVTFSMLVYGQYISASAMVLKPHHTIDDKKHVSGESDKCSVMGIVGNLMYNDADNDNVHDHDTEHVLCIPPI